MENKVSLPTLPDPKYPRTWHSLRARPPSLQCAGAKSREEEGEAAGALTFKPLVLNFCFFSMLTSGPNQLIWLTEGLFLCDRRKCLLQMKFQLTSAELVE